MERNNQLKLLAILFLGIILLNAVISLDAPSPIEIRGLESSVIVSDRAGFDLNNESLTFGAILPGSSASRTVSFVNSFDYPVSVEVYGEGEMKTFIQLNSFEVEGFGKEDFSVIIIVPQDQNYGKYSGNLILEVFSSKKGI